MPNYTAGQGIEITTNPDTISSKTTSSSQLGSFKVDGDSLYVDNNKVLHKKKRQTITLSDTSITVSGSDTVTASTNGDGTLSVQSSNTSIVTASISNGTITLNAVSDGNATVTVTASGTSTWASGSASINVTAEAIHIYGAEWDGSSDPSWTRTDGAVGFEDPNPYYSGMSGTPSSPFDNISPWKDMRIVEDASAGTLVEIPKFYYKWTRNGSTMKLQISPDEQTDEGWHVSPAHADRGDDVGERDYVYIGRYHCASTYKSAAGVTPVANYTRAQFRTSIHNLGTNIWQNDYAMRWTVNMLYLVEFADWNSQDKIGYGCGEAKGNMGYTDNMGYHTGTTQNSRTTYGLGTQYRNIEGWWDNVRDWVDGIYFSGTNIYGIKNPANFSDSSGGTAIGTRASASGYIKAWTEPSVSGFEYALYPNSTDSNLDGTTYIGDNCYYYSSGVVLNAGGGYGQNQEYGAFYLGGGSATTSKSANIGSRLMVLPPSRLSST